MPTCNICKKRYHPNSIKRHVETEHTVKTYHECSWSGCNRRCTQEENLKEHMRTHNREWLQCGRCIFISKQSSEMTRHKQAHHAHPKRGQAGVKVKHFVVDLSQTEAATIKQQITLESRRLTRSMRPSKATSSSSIRRALQTSLSVSNAPSMPEASPETEIQKKSPERTGRYHPDRLWGPKLDESPHNTPWDTQSRSAPPTEYSLPIYSQQPSPSFPSSYNSSTSDPDRLWGPKLEESPHDFPWETQMYDPDRLWGPKLEESPHNIPWDTQTRSAPPTEYSLPIYSQQPSSLFPSSYNLSTSDPDRFGGPKLEGSPHDFSWDTQSLCVPTTEYSPQPIYSHQASFSSLLPYDSLEYPCFCKLCQPDPRIGRSIDCAGMYGIPGPFFRG